MKWAERTELIFITKDAHKVIIGKRNNGYPYTDRFGEYSKLTHKLQHAMFVTNWTVAGICKHGGKIF
jgi:hypothetical protein